MDMSRAELPSSFRSFSPTGDLFSEGVRYPRSVIYMSVQSALLLSTNAEVFKFPVGPTVKG